MSVDFYECEVCGECIYEDACRCIPTSVANEAIRICNNCLNTMQRKGEIELYDDSVFDEDEEMPQFIKDDLDIQEAIKDYGLYIKYTKKGLQVKLDNIKKSIKNKLEMIEEIDNMLYSKV